MGAWASLHLSRLDIGRLKYKAFYQLALVNPHPSYKALKNRWFLSIPLVILVSLACSYVSIQSVLLAHSVLVRANEIQMVQEQKQRIEDKNIDIHPTALKNYDTKEALDYAYAYYSGRKISNRGRIVEDFPMSIYKSKAILKYLVDNRQNERARFILGALTEGGKGKKLVDSAAENGDEFAQYYSMLKFGCQYQPDKVRTLLEGRYRLAKEDALKSEIAKVLEYGFDYMCGEELSRFHYGYIRDYRE